MTPEDQARIIVAAGYPFGPLRDDSWLEMPASAMITAVAFAIRNEREACAKIVEGWPSLANNSNPHVFAESCECADAIRNRS